MIVERGSDLILKLELEDIKGLPLRVEDTVSFTLKVFTTGDGYITVDKADIIVEDDVDKAVISSTSLEGLNSGVIAYSYSYGISDEYFGDKLYNKVKTVYTDFYLRNVEKTYPADNIIEINGHKLNGDITLTPDDLGLGNVDNTSDLDKPISTATLAALNSLDAEVSTAITNVTNKVTANESNINTLSGNVNTINENVNTISGKVNNIESSLANKANLINGTVPTNELPLATTTTNGTVKLYNTNGVNKSGLLLQEDGSLLINTSQDKGLYRDGVGQLHANIKGAATDAEIDEKTSTIKALTPANIDKLKTVFTGEADLTEIIQRLEALEDIDNLWYYAD